MDNKDNPSAYVPPDGNQGAQPPANQFIRPVVPLQTPLPSAPYQQPYTAAPVGLAASPHYVQGHPTPQQQPMNSADADLLRKVNERYQMLPPVGKQWLMNVTRQTAMTVLTNVDLFNRLYQGSLAQQRQQLLASAAGARLARKGDDVDDDQLPPVESSDEAEFSDAEEEDENFETLPPDYVPPEIPKRIVETRQNKKRVDWGDWYADEDAEEEEEGVEVNEQLESFVNRLEHIYMNRVSKSGVEYLLRFQESPPGMCQWVPESVVEVLPNGKRFIERFQNTAPFSIDDIAEDTPILYPVAHRKQSPDAKRELLYRLLWENNAIFFWDIPDEEAEKKYFASRKSIPVVPDPAKPGPDDVLPEPNSSLITSGSGDVLRDYQVLGVKWLVDCWKQGHGSILADEMGLGKTIQLLSFLVYLNRYCNWHGPFAIIVRANTFKQWSEEIAKWTDLSFVAYQSFPTGRSLMREYQFPALDEMGNPIPDTLSFNILLVTYDVFLKDVEYMEKIPWQVLVLDEGHRIKNSQGKKNQAFASINAHHRIILTGTPIQNSLAELWTLLRFVSPDAFSESPEFLETEMDELTNETIFEIKNLIAPHLLHRSLQDVEHSIAPKEERVVFVGLTDVQQDLTRLVKLHKSWRLKGVAQGNEEEAEGSNEPHLLFRVCSHPFLLPDAETFYAKRLKIKDRAEFLLRVSMKFQWLDNVLRVLHQGNHRVLIFSQRVELLKLLDEFVGLRGYSKEMLIGAMTDTEKQSAIDNYRRNNCFIFLISTKAGSEGLNLTEADTAILFDPDWNPQNDIQAQARCHRIGQTHKVDVLRLCTFQTYEHYIFVKAQKKLGLWLTILGSKDVSILHQTKPEDVVLRPPPSSIVRIDDSTMTLDSVLEKTSTVLTDFSLDTVPVLEEALKEADEIQYEIGDEEFIESFPVVIEGTGKRAKRSRSREIMLNRAAAESLFYRMKKFGFQQWDLIGEGEDYEIDQIRRFCLMLTMLSFRALKPVLITYFPVLTARLIQELACDEVYVKLEDFVCKTRGAWAQPFNDDFGLSSELDACKKIKDLIVEDPFLYLSVIEMRLIAVCWSTFNSVESFKWCDILPPYRESDRELLQAITSYDEFDPFDERVQAVINVMRSDIITAQMMDEYAEITPYWTEIEYANVVAMIRNFPVDFANETELHAKTTILGKLTYEVVNFTQGLIDLLTRRKKGKGIAITERMAHINDIPVSIMKESMRSWLQVSAKNASEIQTRMELITLVQAKIVDLGSPVKTEEWGPYYIQNYLEMLLKHGIDSMRALLIDERYDFRQFVSESDALFIAGEVKRRDIQNSNLPDYVFNEADLMDYLRGDYDSVSGEVTWSAGEVSEETKPAKKQQKRAPPKKKTSPSKRNRMWRSDRYRDSDDFDDDDLELSDTDD